MGERGYSVWAWLLQAFTGLLLVVLVALHMVANHFAKRGLLTYRDVAALFADPYWLVLQLALLFAVIYHGLNGLRAVILDAGLSPAGARRLDWALFALGAAMAAYGVGLALSIGGWLGSR
ncbi:MAG: succinate dehydrogenase [Firmicutes bacterium]|nr:succinate dehydrogenase [Bacillota bacterium]